ncbi:hypothetical protein [Spirosoma endbachense]|uniref:Cytochrome c domain-containing protein n=1 Tax=Spirosoma endbachense TaxID=2666025 RepID=A0A6P1W7I2_9BACT|nr:hypothetical protein [Spirosoma endbachense]QHV99666.1 hypothetical protein GJR95_33720 [Spirosoma endbachense]
MKKIVLTGLVVSVGLLLLQCGQSAKQETKEEGTANATMASAEMPGVPIKPVSLPDPGIPGFKFPEAETVVDKWIDGNELKNIYVHGWGIWTALNMNSGETYNGENLRVFETWLTPDDITQAIKGREVNKSLQLANMKRTRGRLHVPNQLIHAKKHRRLQTNAQIPTTEADRILAFVKYDPSAAEFTIKNTLYDSTTLQTMLNNGQTDVPDFPNTSITTKPVFQIITQDSLKNGYYKLKVWSGPPKTPIPYGPDQWPGYVYIDLSNRGKGDGSIDRDGKGPTPQTTYNVSDFVHFNLDKETARQLSEDFNLKSAREGDVAILLAMHVTSRETKRWTWQTFWWAPNADKPPLPSSSAIADSRPKQLIGPARHYAMAIAYTFINPNQPLVGGNNIGTSIYAYNPYLEAGFDESTFFREAKVMTNGKLVVNNVGVQTNCMSCHALAAFFSGEGSQEDDYIADTYLSMKDPYFTGKLKVDFLWSIRDNVGNLLPAKKEKVAQK